MLHWTQLLSLLTVPPKAFCPLPPPLIYNHQLSSLPCQLLYVNPMHAKRSLSCFITIGHATHSVQNASLLPQDLQLGNEGITQLPSHLWDSSGHAPSLWSPDTQRTWCPGQQRQLPLRTCYRCKFPLQTYEMGSLMGVGRGQQRVFNKPTGHSDASLFDSPSPMYSHVYSQSQRLGSLTLLFSPLLFLNICQFFHFEYPLLSFVAASNSSFKISGSEFTSLRKAQFTLRVVGVPFILCSLLFGDHATL